MSGPEARAIAGAILSPVEWRPWQAHLADLLDFDRHTIDQVVATFFQAPRSYTAEDVVEISCHGSPVVLRHALSRAVEAGARLAEPGEFTLRAFLNGRIDLPQAEAVRDLIEATTLYQARIAAQQVSGSVSRRIAPLKEQLLELIALLEAGIDFAEDDVSVAPADEILGRLAPIREGLGKLAASFQYGSLVRQGLTLAIVGLPNVGKSSLFNRLLEQDRAIVTEIPGTTRDVVSETAAISGIPVKLLDTAGIRQGTELVERLGIERSYQAMADADLTLVVVDLSEPLTDEDRALMARAASQGRCLLVGNKCDLASPAGRGSPSRSPRSPERASRAFVKLFWRPSHPKARSKKKAGSLPACGTSSFCASRQATWIRPARPWKPAFPRDAASRPLRCPASHRRHHRRHHRGRHPEPDLYDILYRKIARPSGSPESPGTGSFQNGESGLKSEEVPIRARSSVG